MKLRYFRLKVEFWHSVKSSRRWWRKRKITNFVSTKVPLPITLCTTVCYCMSHNVSAVSPHQKSTLLEYRSKHKYCIWILMSPVGIIILILHFWIEKMRLKCLLWTLGAWDTDFCNWFLLLAGSMVGQSSEGSVIYGKCCARQNM